MQHRTEMTFSWTERTMLGDYITVYILPGDRTKFAEVVKSSSGKTISSIKIDDRAYHNGALVIEFDDGTILDVYDDRRTCCEQRYLHTDDDLSHYEGAQFLDIEISHAKTFEWDDYVIHEVQFLVVTTSKGTFTVDTNNVHNGYCGGFALVARLRDTDE